MASFGPFIPRSVFTNIPGITFPLEFRYQQFEELEDGKSKAQFEYFGVANKAKTVSVIREVLRESENYYYIDCRFRQERWTTSFPMPMPSARRLFLGRGYNRFFKKKRHRNSAARLPFYRFLIRLAILIIF